MTDRSLPDVFDFDADLVVLGGGMAGMAAAAYAGQQGHSVLVVEKSDAIGGSALLSSATLFTAETYDLMREFDPDGDPDLGRALFDRFLPAVDWVRSLGLDFSGERRGIAGHGLGYTFDVVGYFARTKRIVETNDGTVLLGAEARRLIVGDGRVVGAEIEDRSGVTSVRARAVLIATGGFQGDPALCERYIGPEASNLVLRSNPHSTGGGLRVALEAGAATTPQMHTFYGHLIATPLKRFEPQDYLRFAQLASPHCLLVDASGKRFTDESRGYFRNAQATLRRPGSHALMIGDALVDREVISQPAAQGSVVIDRLEEARRDNANIFEAATWEALGEAVNGWGFNGAALGRTVAEYNERIRADSLLDPPRSLFRRTYLEPPFFAMEVVPAITFTYGGIRINTSGEVLDVTDAPIPGLYAAGADAAGAFGGGYAGGLANGLVFGITGACSAFGLIPPWDKSGP